jgi:transglutaminase-like putative cysteine protease
MSPNQIGRNFNLGLLALLCLNILPHTEDHLIVILTFTLLSLSWRLGYEYQLLQLPKKLVKTLLVTFAFFIIYKIYGRFSGVEAATGILIAGISLKMVDNNRYHDAMVILFLNFLLLMSRFLVSQSLPMTLLGVLNIIIVTGLLVHLHKGENLELNFKALIKLGLKLFIQAAPLLVLLFFVFPRYSVGFFKLNQDAKAKSGFSPRVEPGSVSKLVASDETAFRVSFSQQNINMKNLYWRGATLEVTQGMSWGPSPEKKMIIRDSKEQISENNLKNIIDQKIVLEPHYGDWIFALDRPIKIEFRDRIKNSQLAKESGVDFRIKNNTGQKISYDVRSLLVNSIDEKFEDKHLQIVEDKDPRLLKLIEEVKTNSENSKEIVNAYLLFFKKNLAYTLTPPKMKTKNVSEFLFDTQQGFCEHIAASMAYLLRATGVPSRVVVGFHGAIKNDFGDHFLVKEKDAHAWLEYWDQDSKIWNRVDPTEVVAPMRLELGAEVYYSLTQEELSAGLSQDQYLEMYKSSWYYQYIVKTELAFDWAALNWNQFLLNFDREGQKNLFEKLGLKDIPTKYLFYVSLFLICLFYFFQKWKSSNKSKSSVQKSYDLLVELLVRKGLKKLQSTPPKTYLIEAKTKWPHLADLFTNYYELYEKMVYSRKTDTKALEIQFKSLQKSIQKNMG